MKKDYDPPSARPRVLFVCVHNSARSQMAEAWLSHLFGDRFEAESAGLKPGVINPLAIEAMREVGIDISGRRTQAVFDLVKAGRLYAYVISVCDQANSERCPIFAGITRHEQWSFPDPSAFTGTRDECLDEMRKVRDAIKIRIQRWVHKRENTQNFLLGMGRPSATFEARGEGEPASFVDAAVCSIHPL